MKNLSVIAISSFSTLYSWALILVSWGVKQSHRLSSTPEIDYQRSESMNKRGASAQRIHLSSMSQAALVEYPGYHLQSRGEIQVKGKGLMNTYFLCGKEGFKKELPKWDIHDDKDSGCGRPSVTSINSMASLVSNPSFNSTASSKNPKTSSSSLNSNSSNSRGLSDEWDRRYRSKQTRLVFSK